MGSRYGHHPGPPGHAPAVPSDLLARHPHRKGPPSPRRRDAAARLLPHAQARPGDDRPCRTARPTGSSRSSIPTSGCRSTSGSASCPVLIYDTEDGNVRCTSCNICAKVCPPQCIWMSQAKSPKGTVVPLPEDFYIDMDVCMNCGLCSEYCPFDAIKMDHNFELSNYERHQTHIFNLQDLLVSSEFYARTPPRGVGQRRRGHRAEQGGQEEGPAAPEGPGSRQARGAGQGRRTGQGLRRL